MVVLALIACDRWLPGLQEADQHHRRRVLQSGARAVPRRQGADHGLAGRLDRRIEPAGDKMKVTFHYDSEYKVPADATASVLNPSLVASRTIQLSPRLHRRTSDGGRRGDPARAHTGAGRVGRPAQRDHQHRHPARTHLRSSPRARSATVIESFADGLAGKGQQINTTLTKPFEAVTALNDSRGDFFATVKSLALFVNALHDSDQQFVALNDNLASFTNKFTNSDQELADAIQQGRRTSRHDKQFRRARTAPCWPRTSTTSPTSPRRFFSRTPRNGLETALHVLPTWAPASPTSTSPPTGR